MALIINPTNPVGIPQGRIRDVELSGKVVVVPAELADLATRMAARGATVVLVGPDADALGRVAGTIETAGTGRPAVFVSDGSPDSLDALAAFLSELFRAP